jgi:hypothetical protein
MTTTDDKTLDDLVREYLDARNYEELWEIGNKLLDAITALRADRDEARLHIKKRLRAPSGELICCCRNAAERSSNYCWYCAARDMLDEK